MEALAPPFFYISENILFHVHKLNSFKLSCEFSDFFGGEFDGAVSHCEKSIVRAALHVFSGPEFCSALADDDISGPDFFSAEFFDAQAL